ncbi:hypothetical protein FQN54_005414 [Arachnomyces sp. PD_36]|nr:hypothetical protein FQN54_005414 [Arachnomyces sp. PD_36]
MKFAKELEEDLVPEWRAKYLNYKAGKKRVKAISRSLRYVNQSPRTPGGWRRKNQGSAETGDHPAPPGLTRYTSYPFPTPQPGHGKQREDATVQERPVAGSDNQTLFMSTPPTIVTERHPLKASRSGTSKRAGDYGSTARPGETAQLPELPALTLPEPALRSTTAPSVASKPQKKRRYSVSTWKIEKKKHIPYIRRTHPDTDFQSPGNRIPTEVYAEINARQNAFFMFLDHELEKIEAFYRLKEAEATDRLEVLREQLHVMRDRRLEEVLEAKRKKESKGKDGRENSSSDTKEYDEEGAKPGGAKWKKPIQGAFGRGSGHQERTKTLEDMVTPPGPAPKHPTEFEARRDYVRRAERDTVPYRTAKRKLKLALKEFYRGLELLKAYVHLNRKAFRKINKKYDKATNARPTGRYVSERVNNAWFVQSDIIENHLVAVEDLYTRYFERGNRKNAVGKLRSKSTRSDDYSPNTFRNGLLLAAGSVFGIQGLVYAIQLLSDPDSTIRSQTSFLLQLYGGLFLILFHFLIFCMVCRIWSLSRINYAFVFEFDTRHVLDWRQLAEIPCFLFFSLGLLMWINFSWIGNAMFLYWVVVLIALTVLLVFLPFRVFYHRARRWWAFSNFRLLLPGLFSVEFRDFFLGDMYCSQTYATGNISLFFCLYANGWDEPGQCNSHHSRLMGFFASLPPILRALQCLRRYRDTKNVFPHLANFMKYLMSVLYLMTLSLYRITDSTKYRAIFITFACINAIFCSVWDLFMDWSLFNPNAKHPFLRNVLGFRKVWVYYAAMILDPILRFNWVFYAIYAHDIQHSAVLSFFVAFSEVCRRGMWSIFRVENEHCANVHRFRASRDIPLPYALSPPVDAMSIDEGAYDRTLQQDPILGSPYGGATETGTTTGADVDLERVATTDTTRRRRMVDQQEPGPMVRGMSRVGALMATAHAQDFERKKKPDALSGDIKDMGGDEMRTEDSTDYEDDDDDDDDEEDEEGIEDDGTFDDPENRAERGEDVESKEPQN